MDVEDTDGIVEWVWKDVVLAGVSDGVLPHRGVLVYGRGEVWSVLCDGCARGRIGSEYGLLEGL